IRAEPVEIIEPEAEAGQLGQLTKAGVRIGEIELLQRRPRRLFQRRHRLSGGGLLGFVILLRRRWPEQTASASWPRGGSLLSERGSRCDRCENQAPENPGTAHARPPVRRCRRCALCREESGPRRSSVCLADTQSTRNLVSRSGRFDYASRQTPDFGVC